MIDKENRREAYVGRANFPLVKDINRYGQTEHIAMKTGSNRSR